MTSYDNYIKALTKWAEEVDQQITKLQKNVDRLNSIVVSIAYEPEDDIPKSEVLN